MRYATLVRIVPRTEQPMTCRWCDAATTELLTIRVTPEPITGESPTGLMTFCRGCVEAMRKAFDA